MIAAQLANGIMEGLMLFMIASGLTLIFGVSRIVNFAHGSFYMIGAFIASDLVGLFEIESVFELTLVVLVAGLVVGILGALFEASILRHVYREDMLMQLLTTIALVLIIRDAVKAIWGIQMVSTALPRSLAGALQIGETYLPIYPMVVAAFGLLVAALMVFAMRYTRAGVLLRATTDDPGMIGLLGINQKYVLTSVFAAGCFLAGMAGALAAPYNTINHLLDTTVIIGAFVVVVIGGLGSLPGAFFGAITVGVVKAFGVVYAERMSMILIFVVMAIILILRSLYTKDAAP